MPNNADFYLSSRQPFVFYHLIRLIRNRSQIWDLRNILFKRKPNSKFEYISRFSLFAASEMLKLLFLSFFIDTLCENDKSNECNFVERKQYWWSFFRFKFFQNIGDQLSRLVNNWSFNQRFLNHFRKTRPVSNDVAFLSFLKGSYYWKKNKMLWNYFTYTILIKISIIFRNRSLDAYPETEAFERRSKSSYNWLSPQANICE